jgi:hypothetical protein
MALLLVIIIIVALVVVAAAIAGIWWSSEGFDSTLYPVSRLRNEYLAGMATYSNCPYIRLPARPANWHPKLKVHGPGEIEKLRSQKWVYTDNPIYNFF